jgi:hypothetical protein
MMYRIIFLQLLFLCYGLSAQNSKKGFKQLEKAEYEKSYEDFSGVLEDDNQNPAALLGCALIFADDRSPLFNLIGAWEFASILKPNIEKLSPEEIEFIGEYFRNTETRAISRPVKKKIEYAVETIEAKLIKHVREENNLEIVYSVLEKFPDFRHTANVMHIRNQLEFRNYEKSNTLDGYVEFIGKFPDAAQVDKAKKYRNKLAFEKASQVNTVEAYKEYIRQYPKAIEYNQAIKNLNAVAFMRAKQINSIKAFDDFIAEYPDALEIGDAKKLQMGLLYEYAKKIQTLEAYNEFIRKYPEGQQYIDIFNLKSLDNGMRYIGSHPVASNNIQWARSFENEETGERSASLAVDSLNAYILGGTVFRNDTGSTDVWIIKLGDDGKMIWNKYIGEGYNDELQMLVPGKKQEIIGAGYTWLGTDSSSRESWLFKLGPDGQKLWSKKLGNLHIRTVLQTAAGSVFLGGFQEIDTSGRKYSIMALNENGKKLWSRTYTGNGEIIGLSELPDKRILIAGNNWRAKIDTRGYIVWESLFKETDSILTATVLRDGEILYTGLRQGNNQLIIKTGPDNKILFEKEITGTDVLQSVHCLLPGNQNQLISLCNYSNDQTITWINTLTGDIQKSVSLPREILFSGICTDMRNNLLLVGFTGEMLLIKNGGITF